MYFFSRNVGEVVFQVKYADNPDEIWLCHPDEMRNIVGSKFPWG